MPISGNGEDHRSLDERVADILYKRHRFRWRALWIWIVIFSTVTILNSCDTRKATGNNKDRIADIQASRVESCARAYDAFPKFFRPFFPKHMKDWAPKQHHDWQKLLNRAAELKKGCPQQVRILK